MMIKEHPSTPRRHRPVLAIAAAIFVFCALLPSLFAQQQDTGRTKENWVYRIDERGDATVEYKIFYTASEWAKMRDNRPDLVQRNLRYLLASSVIEDFSMEKDDLQRSTLVKFKARAYALYRGAGDFVVRIEKEDKLATGGNSEWFFNRSGESGIEATQLKLPANAENVSFAPGADYNELSYTLHFPSSLPKHWRYAGIGMLSAGATLLLILLLTRRKDMAVGEAA